MRRTFGGYRLLGLVLVDAKASVRLILIAQMLR